jgi:hypothetical protein
VARERLIRPRPTASVKVYDGRSHGVPIGKHVRVLNGLAATPWGVISLLPLRSSSSVTSVTEPRHSRVLSWRRRAAGQSSRGEPGMADDRDARIAPHSILSQRNLFRRLGPISALTPDAHPDRARLRSKKSAIAG